ncbi:Cap [Circular ssDNA virus sp.]|nr:Cap [Circular ssDNA virus sp.]
MSFRNKRISNISIKIRTHKTTTSRPVILNFVRTIITGTSRIRKILVTTLQITMTRTKTNSNRMIIRKRLPLIFFLYHKKKIPSGERSPPCAHLPSGEEFF